MKACFDSRSYDQVCAQLRNRFIQEHGFEDFFLFDSGRHALYWTLIHAERNKQEVVLPAFSCSVLPLVVRKAGKIPVYADVDPHSFSLDFDDVNKKISSQTAAIIVVHEFGMPVPLPGLNFLRNRFNGMIIEDAAIALGSLYPDGSKVGSIGDYTIFSGGLGKPVSAASWGGLGVKKRQAKLCEPYGKWQSSLVSMLKILALQTIKIYPIYNLVRPLLLESVQEEAASFPNEMKRPSHLDNVLMLKHIENIDSLRFVNYASGIKILDLLKKRGVHPIKLLDHKPMFSRIPFVLPTNQDRSRFERVFKKWGIEVQKPYQSDLSEEKRTDCRNVVNFFNAILTIAIQHDPRFFKRLDIALQDIGLKQLHRIQRFLN